MIKILIVDHAAENPRSVRKLLAAAGVTGFEIAYATSYRDILEGFRDKSYDVCLIDSASGNALRLTAQARSISFTAPIILVTSNDANEVMNAIRIGVADCLIRDVLTAASIERSICCVVEQARAIAQQNDRDRRYLALMDNADEIIATQDLEGNFTSINRTGERLIGYSPEEILGRNVSQIVAPKHRDLLKRMIRRTLDAQKMTLQQIDLVTNSGQGLRVEVSTHLIYQQGNPIEVQIIARDIHARTHSYIAPRQAMESSPVSSTAAHFAFASPHSQQRVVVTL